MKSVNPEVFVSEDRIVTVGAAQLETLKKQAARNARRRCRLCAHKTPQDRLHEMFIVLARGIYIRPHKHIGKTESFHVIEGAADIIFFDDVGGIEEVLRVDSAGIFYFRNDEPRFHTQIVITEFLVVHEITNGPFDRTDTVGATWAPDESDVAAGAAYLECLKRDVAPV